MLIDYQKLSICATIQAKIFNAMTIFKKLSTVIRWSGFYFSQSLNLSQ